MGHVAALDGLRGLALLGVLLFHAHAHGQGVLRGGYLGVDLFFVLSGYLITALLVEEHRRTGTVRLGAFWVRRARRLLPALLALMPAIALYAWFVAKPDELRGLRADALATLGYVANWRAIYAHKSYWELFVAPSPLEHTWSLAIEEQFYVVWPLVVLAVLSRGLGRLRGVCVALGVASMVAMFVLAKGPSSSRAYMGTDTRATSILMGATLATWLRGSFTLAPSRRRILDVAGFAAAAAVGALWWRLDGTSPLLYEGGFWLHEALAVVVIVAATAEGSWVGRALSWRPLRWLGMLSYGVYLWHWPVDVVMSAERMRLDGPRLWAIQLSVTMVIAVTSFFLLERPIRRRGLPFGRPVFVVPAVAALAVTLVVRATHARKPTTSPVYVHPAELETPPPSLDHETFRVMVVGDSTANSLGWALRGLRAPGVEITLHGRDSCTMLWDTCYGDSWAAWVNELRPDVALVFLGGAFLHGVDADGRWRQACYPAWHTKFEATLARRLPELLHPGTRVVVLTVPYPLGPYDSPPWRAFIDCINASLRKIATLHPGIEVVDFGDRVCPNGACVQERNGIRLRPDGVHYDIEGSLDVSGWLLTQLVKRD